MDSLYFVNVLFHEVKCNIVVNNWHRHFYLWHNIKFVVIIKLTFYFMSKIRDEEQTTILCPLFTSNRCHFLNMRETDKRFRLIEDSIG